MVGNWGGDALHDWSVVGQRGMVGSGQRSVGVGSWGIGSWGVGWGAVGQRSSEVSSRDGGEEQRESQLERENGNFDFRSLHSSRHCDAF